MAVVLSYTDRINEQTAMEEAATAGLKKAISILNRTGHARFRRGPVQSQTQETSSVVPSQQPTQTLSLFAFSDCSGKSAAAVASSHPSQALTLDFTTSLKSSPKDVDGMGLSLSASANNTTSSTFVSSISGEGSVSNGKGGASAPAMLLLNAPAGGASARKPPLSGKRCREHEHEHSEDVSGRASNGSGRCHCKKRKSRVKRTIRVPAISSKVADIPQDEFSWRKYGQKPIKGSPYPRGYYKCSTVRVCPARKHVERATDDPTMLIVTYEGEHRHAAQENTSQLMAFGSN